MKNRTHQTKWASAMITIVAAIAMLLNACCKDHDHSLTQKEVTITENILGVIVEGPWDVVIVQDSENNSALLEYSTSAESHISSELLPNGYLHLKISYRGNIGNKVFRARLNATALEKVDAFGAASIRTYGNFDTFSSLSLSGASKLEGLACAGDNAQLSLSGASKLKEFTFTGNSLDADLSGASDAALNITVNDCTVECSGASKCEGKGTTADCSFTGSGSSSFKMFRLEAEKLDIGLSGASVAEVTVNSTIKGSLTGASTLRYKRAIDVSGVHTDNSSKIIRVD